MYANVNAAPVAGANVAPMATAPSYGYGGPSRTGDTFVLIVVLFILLIIVGAVCYC